MRSSGRVGLVLAVSVVLVAGVPDPAGPPPDEAPSRTAPGPAASPSRSEPAAGRSATRPPAPAPTRPPAPAPTRPSAPAATPTPSAAPSPAPSASPSTTPSPTFEDAVADGTGAARAEHGLAALARSDCADRFAADRAAALVGTGRLEHAPLDPIMSACGARAVGENLVLAAPDAAAMLRLWMDSPGHRANILEPRFTHLGVGCADDGRQRICAQVFLG